MAGDILTATEESPRVEPEPARADLANPSTEEASGIGSTGDETAEPLKELTLGRFASPQRAEGTAWNLVAHIERSSASQGRSRPAAGSRPKRLAGPWSGFFDSGRGMKRRDEGVSEDPQVAAFADRMTDWFYWMKSSDPSGRSELAVLEDVAGCYEVLAEGLAGVGSIFKRNQTAKGAGTHAPAG